MPAQARYGQTLAGAWGGPRERKRPAGVKRQHSGLAYTPVMDTLQIKQVLLAVCLVAAGTVAMGQGTTVYRHVDENGVVTFSDTPPAGEQAAETVNIVTPAAQDPDAYLDNLDAMRETTDRMAADRREREKHRAELREINERSQPPQDSRVVEYREYSDYWPVYGGPVYTHPGRPPWRPGYRPRPEHPIARPPYRPAPPGIQPGPNSQLMRPILSNQR